MLKAAPSTSIVILKWSDGRKNNTWPFGGPVRAPVFCHPIPPTAIELIVGLNLRSWLGASVLHKHLRCGDQAPKVSASA